MLNSCSDKRGVTLIEVLVVVAIMGILSGIGVSNLRDAVMNSRIKDAGINVTAYVERAANEAIRLNTTLCVVASGKTITTYRGDCTEAQTAANQVDQMTLESINAFVTSGVSCPELTGTNPASSMQLVPKVGVSAIPSGCFMIRYGSSDRYAAAVKQSSKFSMYYKLSYNSGSGWM